MTIFSISLHTKIVNLRKNKQLLLLQKHTKNITSVIFHGKNI